MNKRDTRLKICELLDVCRKCEFNKTLHRRNTVSEVCKQCHVYQDMSNLGNQIWGTKTIIKFTLDIEEYMKMRNQGLLDVQIAEKLIISISTLVNWKRKNKQELTNLGLYRKSSVKS